MTSSTAANVSRQHDTQLQLPSRLASNASPAQPTILRIRRRKRDEHETLDALCMLLIPCMARSDMANLLFPNFKSLTMGGNLATDLSSEADKVVP